MIALITGANRGLGRSMALHLAESGVDVIGTYRNNDAEAADVVRQVEAKGRKAVMLRLNVSNTAEFSGFADELKETLKATFAREQFDFLVNNAGSALYAPIADVTEAQFDEAVNVHFKGVVFLTQRLLPLIADGGRILNISSGLARMTFPGSAIYAANKSAIETFTRYLAKELGPRRITANVVAPGAIETDFGNGRVRDNPEINQQVASITALGRVGLPDDVGLAVAGLLSDAGRWINGQRIEVSGGQGL
ncbi:MAG TPA: SDR family oxidoreductase [Gemmatimonadaceae bacterium]|jgi:NAD(P)-dependent dehydrogenase (short-subunit alcohol dehydrogenase family)